MFALLNGSCHLNNLLQILYKCINLYSEIEFEKRRKRRKLFRERSVSPIIIDDEVCIASEPLRELLTDNARRVDSASAGGHDTQLKALFLFKHDLQPIDLHLKQSEIYLFSFTRAIKVNL